MDFSGQTNSAYSGQARQGYSEQRDRLDQLRGKLPAWLIDDARRLQSHAQFHAAVTLYAETVIKNFRKLPFLARITSGETRYLLCTALIAYNYTCDPDALETCASVSRLQNFSTRFRLSSPNRIVAFLALLQFAGAVRITRSAADRRVKLVNFTDAAIAHGDKMGLGTLRPLQLLSPKHDHLKAWEKDPGFRGRYYSKCLQIYDTARIVRVFPEIDMFSNQDAAGELKFRMWLDLPADGKSTVAFPYGQIAREFGVSRAHVRRVFENCQENGLLVLHKAGGLAVEFLPAFSQSLKAFVSLEMALMMHAADHAASQKSQRGSMAWLND